MDDFKDTAMIALLPTTSDSLDKGTGLFNQEQATLLALVAGQRGLDGGPPIDDFYVPMDGLGIGKPGMKLLTFGPKPLPPITPEPGEPGPSGSAGTLTILGGGIGAPHSTSGLPTNLTTGFSFGDGAISWDLSPRTVNLPNASGGSLTGVLHVVVPYFLLCPNPSSGSEVIQFSFVAKIMLDATLKGQRIAGSSFPSKAGAAANSGTFGQAVLTSPIVIPNGGADLFVVIETGTVYGTGSTSSPSTLTLDTPTYTFIGQ